MPAFPEVSMPIHTHPCPPARSPLGKNNPPPGGFALRAGPIDRRSANGAGKT